MLERTRGENVLDIVLSSHNELVDNVKIHEPLGNSDHNQIHFDNNIKSESKNKKTYRGNFHKGNYKDLRKYLAKLDWNNMLMNETAIECWNILKYEIKSTPLAKLFNLSLEEGIVPSEWKEANFTPLFKKGSRNKPENYIPVSLTSVVCKLLETFIRDHMVEFIVKHKLINTSQHVFLKAKSCLTNLLCCFEDITKWVDDGSPVDVVYLDVQKAFDKVII